VPSPHYSGTPANPQSQHVDVFFQQHLAPGSDGSALLMSHHSQSPESWFTETTPHDLTTRAPLQAQQARAMSNAADHTSNQADLQHVAPRYYSGSSFPTTPTSMINAFGMSTGEWDRRVSASQQFGLPLGFTGSEGDMLDWENAALMMPPPAMSDEPERFPSTSTHEEPSVTSETTQQLGPRVQLMSPPKGLRRSRHK
jgi:hypothetical protein